MPKFAVCSSCEGRGATSAHLGAFTSDDMHDMDDEFMEDYFAGSFDRTCKDCKGQNVVPVCQQDNCSNPRSFMEGYFGNVEGKGCDLHPDEDFIAAADVEQMSRAERAYGC